jgi:HEAT repeat protein
MLLGWATNGVMRRTSVLALGYIHAEPDQVVPVLIESLHDPDLSVQLSALASLGDFGPEAKLAVPVLVELLNATDEYVRGDVTNALKAIDPEAAAKAGIK